MAKDISIVLVGVGGQGTLVAGKLMGIIALKLGMDVKVSEVHGMSQRGGSVVTYVRIGDKVFSPIVEKSTADYVLSFEKLEAVRWANLLKKDGKLVVNTTEISPLPVLMKKATYPENIEPALDDSANDSKNVIALDALKIATEAGSPRAVNMVMMGVLSHYTDISIDVWEEGIKEVFASKEKLIPTNLKAFESGREIAAGNLV